MDHKDHYESQDFFEECQEWEIKYIHVSDIPDLDLGHEGCATVNFLLENFSDVRANYCIMSYHIKSEEQVIRYFNKCYWPHLMAISAAKSELVKTPHPYLDPGTSIRITEIVKKENEHIAKHYLFT